MIIKNGLNPGHKRKRNLVIKIVNHEYFDDICLSLNIIETSNKIR